MDSRKKRLSKSEMKEDDGTKLRTGGDWTKRVNVDIPVWAIKELDLEAGRRGITRQALIKTWLIDRIDAMRARRFGGSDSLEGSLDKYTRRGAS